MNPNNTIRTDDYQRPSHSADVSALLFLLAFFLRFGNLITGCMPDTGKSNRRVMTDESNN
jgi:hypothetical protein